MCIRVCFSFLLLHSVLLFCNGFHVPEFLGNETDRVALLEFKSKITHDPLDVLASWNESIHFCKWHGVTCSRRHQQRVIILNLKSLNLAGSISPHIGNLSFLKVLKLQNNGFTHEIPSEIGCLRRLQVLALHNNSIGGGIPSNMSRCSNLVEIYLSHNLLVGKIPSELSSLPKIEVLHLDSNNLTGSIPSSLGNLSCIQKLFLGDNKLDGSIPDSVGSLKNLEELSLAENRLSGTLPSSIFNISSLVAFDVGVNRVQGGIPLDFGFTLPNLLFLSLGFNQITGVIPSSMFNASKLEVFQVTSNNLTGEVPSLEKLQRLTVFRIATNSLGSGGHHDLNFLCSLTNATSLKHLDINNNNFGGLLPGCICNLSITLETLILNSNKIFGSIPAGIGKFINLQTLHMWDNQLSGTISPAIGELQNLVTLALNANRLSGNIPPSIGNLKKLLQLYLFENFLQGSIPSSLGQCQSLTTINLSYNNLSGTIPPQLMDLTSLSVGLDLSRNQLVGSLPTEVGKLINLEILFISRNMLEGEIPSTLGSCIKLEQFKLGGNLFQGPIPLSLSSLRGLRVLELSQNNISGEIPKFLVELQLVQNLNLSYNDLEGVIPTEGVFKNASAISVFGNSKLCGGIPEFQLPICGSEKSKHKRLTIAVKLAAAIISVLVGILLSVSFLFLCWVRKRKDKKKPNSSINSLRHLSYQNLYNATDGFSSANQIGMGSFGSVYKGILDEGKTIIAVKVLNLLHHGASKSFIAECSALRNIRHRNLVKILTVCSGVDYKDKTVEAPKRLNFLQRINIAIDVACALKYLHHDCQPATAHCDLKPSNVLLDHEMTAHVADFGLAKLLPPAHLQTSSIGVKGTIGYIAPEYGLGSEVSINGDVYSYGILLLELMTRKRPSDIMFEGNMNLHNFARTVLPDHVMDIVDSTLLADDEDLTITSNQRQRQARINNIMECLISVVRIGVACSMESPQDRMNMTIVVHELQSIKSILLGPKTVSNKQKGNQMIQTILQVLPVR
ncbi:putative receptor-like protein kinase [Citrus sinensis]|nr:putative receptor-like protein kinase [Citrus sinensis]